MRWDYVRNQILLEKCSQVGRRDTECSIAQLGQLGVNGGGLAGDIGDGLVLDGLLLLLVLPVQLGLCLALGLKGGNDVLVLPAGLGGETANWGVLAVGLELDLAVARGQQGAADLVVWGGDALEGLNIQNMYTFIRDEITY